MIFLDLLLTFIKIGAFTFGGGYAMLPLIQSEVASHGWITQEELVNFIAISESTPGPFAINISTYIGKVVGEGSPLGLFGGFLGAFCATLGVVLPSFVIILIVAKFYAKFKKNKYVAGCMSGLKPAVIGLLSSSVISLFLSIFFGGSWNLEIFTTVSLYISLVIFAGALVMALKKVKPILIICISAVLGIIAGYIFGL